MCVDVGSGHGIVARAFAPSFSQVLGTDPSIGMIEQARSSTLTYDFPNVSFEAASAENMPFIKDQSVDMVVAGQAAHWFDLSSFWPEMRRIVRKGGTLALWCYTDPTFVESANATKVLMEYAYGEDERLLGPYWQQPGRSRVQDKLRDLHPPELEWDDVQRIEYEPATTGPNRGEGTRFHHDRMKLGDCMKYVRTWSSFHAWQENHPQARSRHDGGQGDVVDEMFEAMVLSEPQWQSSDNWKEKEVDMERGSGLLLARRK